MNIGDEIILENRQWSFSGQVSQNFDRHIARSLPAYDLGHELILRIAKHYLKPNGNVYDLGCSTGTLSAKLAQILPKNAQIFGLDKEIDMINIARKRYKDFKNVQFFEADLTELNFEKADLVICYYVLQFIDPQDRLKILQKIYDGLNSGGIFLWFEKVKASKKKDTDFLNQLLIDYKLDQGYRLSEIKAKEKSLKGLLLPFTPAKNIGLLVKAGFAQILPVFRILNFEGYLAIK